MQRGPTRLSVQRQAAAVRMFLGFFGFGVLAFELGAGHFERSAARKIRKPLLPSIETAFRMADDTGGESPPSRSSFLRRPHKTIIYGICRDISCSITAGSFG